VCAPTSSVGLRGSCDSVPGESRHVDALQRYSADKVSRHSRVHRIVNKKECIMLRIYAGNLPSDCTEAEFAELFSAYGRVRALELPRDLFRTGRAIASRQQPARQPGASTHRTLRQTSPLIERAKASATRIAHELLRISAAGVRRSTFRCSPTKAVGLRAGLGCASRSCRKSSPCTASPRVAHGSLHALPPATRLSILDPA
jgi:hypothetical protein